MKQYAIYLRKSRADLDAEARGEGETLARHRDALRALAQRRGLFVAREYSEIVSGDSIAARPQMQALLEDVKAGMYAGVIVNDVDRLGRGDSIDQEIIKLTFAASHTLIITPGRDIDPANPTDDDMLDFSMFLARFEYKKISQRLLLGRTRSAQSGNFLSARVPYGYRKITHDKRITLEPDPETAPIVRQIFDWYGSGAVGCSTIANRLNAMGLHTYRGFPWEKTTISKMLKNPVYTGRIVWGKTAKISAIEDGRRVKRTIPGDPAVMDNAHPAIITDAQFATVQARFEASQRARPVNVTKDLVNPFAGIIYCARCGALMQNRGSHKKGEHVVTCLTPGCPTIGTYISIIYAAVVEVLRGWCAEYVPEPLPDASDTDAAIRKQRAALVAQMDRARELVETGVYSPSEYIARRDTLQQRLDALDAIKPAAPTRDQAIAAILPDVRRVLDALPYAQTVAEKNTLLRSIIARIEYSKDVPAKRNEDPASLLSLDIFPYIRF